MELKDYLHLYLGCEIMVPDKEEPDPCTLVAINTQSFFIDSGCDYPIEECKPILRPLSDMTELEAMEVAHLMGINASANDTLMVSKNKDEFIVWNFTDYKDDWEDADNNDAAVLIDTKQKFFSKNVNEGEYYRVPDFNKQAEIFLYLLSKSFDLFGLIESSLAIDKTKL